MKPRLNLNKLKNQCIPYAKGLSCVFLLVLSCSFQYPDLPANPAEGDSNDGKRAVTLHSDDFSNFVNRIYHQISFSQDTLKKEVFEKALRGYMYLKHSNRLKNEKYLSVIDFSKYCNDKRFWIIDLESKSVVFNEMVAHGKNTGAAYAKFFSNTHSSNKSSLGFYTTGGTYYGSKNYSLKLNGLEQGFNSNAFTRGIVIHGADYVGQKFIDYNKTIGRSYGCPAVSKDVNQALIDTIKGGSCLFIYHQTENYLNNSTIMNGNLYITVDDLNI